MLPVRACMTRQRHAAVRAAVRRPAGRLWPRRAADITAALEDGALTPLPPHRYLLDDVAAAHEAVENGVSGKVFVIPAREV